MAILCCNNMTSYYCSKVLPFNITLWTRFAAAGHFVWDITVKYFYNKTIFFESSKPLKNFFLRKCKACLKKYFIYIPRVQENNAKQ